VKCQLLGVETDFNYEKFLQGGHQALDAIYTFWIGLGESRKKFD